MVAARELTPPAQVGSYVVERELARGAMGVVYLAHHEVTHAPVALKLLDPKFASGEQGEARFLREVRAASKVRHEGIVRVHDAGRMDNGVLYVAMELLEGEPFDEWLESGKHGRVEALRLVRAALDPLGAAHAAGIVHRDLKPANLFVVPRPDGGPGIKLLDFGIARETDAKSHTQTGAVLGTPYYMSPEQALDPRKVGPSSDVWSIGVILYEVLYGQMPFDGETVHAVILSAATEDPPPAADGLAVDPRLASLVRRCMHKDAASRPPDAASLARELDALLVDPGVRTSLEPGAAVGALDPAVAMADTLLDSADGVVASEVEAPAPAAGSRRRTGLWVAALLLLGAAVVWWSLAPGPDANRADHEVVPAPAADMVPPSAELPPVEQPTPAPEPPPPIEIAEPEVAEPEPSAPSGDPEAAEPAPRPRKKARRAAKRASDVLAEVTDGAPASPEAEVVAAEPEFDQPDQRAAEPEPDPAPPAPAAVEPPAPASFAPVAEPARPTPEPPPKPKPKKAQDKPFLTF